MTPNEMARLKSYDELTARIWRDKRPTPGARELLLALAWVTERDPDLGTIRRAEQGKYLWKQLRAMLGCDSLGRPRYKQLVADDAPRYEPPNTWPHRACQAPRIRAYKPRTPDTSDKCLLQHHPHLGECRYTIVHIDAATAAKPDPKPPTVCGAPPKWDYHLVEKDPRTGWHIDHYFCARHRDQYERVKAQLDAAPEAPEPVPNTGGLLGCYFLADWARMYTEVRPGWAAPGYGLCADDWPGVVSGGATPRRPRLRLIVGELADA